MKAHWLLLCLLVLRLSGLQAQENRWELPKPEGWKSEEFALPASFASSIPYKGIELIRFSPGWADSTSEGYWSYVFAWQIEGAVAPRADSLRRQLIAYYNGLYLANRGQAPAGYGSQFTQVRVTPEPTPWSSDQASFTGKAYTYNYLTRRQIDLLIKIRHRQAPDGTRTLLLFEVSPKPYNHPFWKKLDTLANKTTFHRQP